VGGPLWRRGARRDGAGARAANHKSLKAAGCGPAGPADPPFRRGKTSRLCVTDCCNVRLRSPQRDAGGAEAGPRPAGRCRGHREAELCFHMARFK